MGARTALLTAQFMLFIGNEPVLTSSNHDDVFNGTVNIYWTNLQELVERGVIGSVGDVYEHQTVMFNLDATLTLHACLQLPNTDDIRDVVCRDDRTTLPL